MANQLGLVHPNLLAALQANFYPSTCAIQQATESQSATGAVVQSFANLNGHTSLACRLAPRSEREVRQTSGIYAEYTHTVALAGYYPTITEKMQVVISSIAYDITGVRHDGNQESTYLLVRRTR